VRRECLSRYEPPAEVRTADTCCGGNPLSHAQNAPTAHDTVRPKGRQLRSPVLTKMPRRRAALTLTALCLLTVSWAQAASDDIVFAAKLTPDEQSRPTESPGSGFAELRLERATLKLSWKVTYKGLTSKVTTVGLYGPENVGANAGQVVNFGNRGLTNPIQGSEVLSDGVFQYLITGRVYINIHTTRYKDGELRGQLRRQRKR
jgi:CHRD domain